MKARRSCAVVLALMTVMLLSSCSLLPQIHDPGDDAIVQTGQELRHIVDAVNSHDSAALEKLFSPRAREDATNLSAGLKYFLSVFPSGLKDNSQSGSGCSGSGNESYPTYWWESSCNYIVKVGETEYDVYLVDVTIDTAHPDAVGIYALGAEPDAANLKTANGAPDPLGLWGSQFGLSGAGLATGTPGVYIPGIAGSVIHVTAPAPTVEIGNIANAVQDHDVAALKTLFSPLAREKAPDFDNQLEHLLSAIPSGHITWHSEGQADCGVERGGYTTAYVEVCPSYRVSVNGNEYDLVFVEFTVDQPNTAAVGIYALGFTAHSGTATTLSKQLSTWAKYFQADFDGNVSPYPGIYIPDN